MNKLPTIQCPRYTKDWYLIAFATKEAHGWQCENCHIRSGDELNNVITVHHKDHNTFNNEDSNLQVLCARCHLRIEGRYRYRRNYDIKLNNQLSAGQLTLPNIEPYLFPQLNSVVG